MKHAQAPSAPRAARGDGADIEDIYHALKRGEGRERVDDANVGTLIEMAQERRDAQLELLLREWRSVCGNDPHAPDPAQVQRLPRAR